MVASDYKHVYQDGVCTECGAVDPGIAVSNEFDYTVNNDEIKDAISDIIFENHFKNIISNIPELKENSDLRKNMFRNINKAIQNMINNCDLADSLSEFYEDELKDYFEQDAMDSWGD